MGIGASAASADDLAAYWAQVEPVLGEGGWDDDSSASSGSDGTGMAPKAEELDESGTDDPPPDPPLVGYARAVGVAPVEVAAIPTACCRHKCMAVFAIELGSLRLKMAALMDSDRAVWKSTVQAYLLSCFVGPAAHPTVAPADRVCDHSVWKWAVQPHLPRLCRDAFMYAMVVNDKALKTLKKWVVKHGMEPFARASKGRATKSFPGGVASYRAREADLENWIGEIVRDDALVLPWRVNKTVTHVLPASHTFAKMYEWYTAACMAVGGADYTPLSVVTFRKMFRRLAPHVGLAKNRSDVCDTCHSYTYLMQRNVNKGEAAVEMDLADIQAHLQEAKGKRELYNIDLGRYTGVAACWESSTVVLAFDFAQSVSVPHHHDQPGQIFFKTPYRIGLFGVYDSSREVMTTFFVPEDVSTSIGKGSDSVISMLHHFLSGFTLTSPDGTADMLPHHIIVWCDNCSGQNKNNFVMQYFAWRCATGFHTRITVNFMVPGHTKFICDAYFGIGKRAWHRSDADTVKEAMDVWAGASPRHLQTVDARDVTFRRWRSNALDLARIPNIKAQHHFLFQSERPWTVDIAIDNVPTWTTVPLACAEPAALGFEALAVVPIQPLPPQRLWYLYKEVRVYCKEENREEGIWAMPAGEPVKYVSDRAVAAGLRAQVASLQAAADGESSSGDEEDGAPHGDGRGPRLRVDLRLMLPLCGVVRTFAGKKPRKRPAVTPAETEAVRAHIAAGGGGGDPAAPYGRTPTGKARTRPTKAQVEAASQGPTPAPGPL